MKKDYGINLSVSSQIDHFLASKKLADQSMTYPIGNIDKGQSTLLKHTIPVITLNCFRARTVLKSP